MKRLVNTEEIGCVMQLTYFTEKGLVHQRVINWETHCTLWEDATQYYWSEKELRALHLKVQQPILTLVAETAVEDSENYIVWKFVNGKRCYWNVNQWHYSLGHAEFYKLSEAKAIADKHKGGYLTFAKAERDLREWKVNQCQVKV